MYLAEILRGQTGWEVTAQRHGRVRGTAHVPDIIIEQDDNTVIIEAEIDPARGLEDDVNSRVGIEIEGRGNPSAIIGIKYPPGIETHTAEIIRDMLTVSEDFEYFVRFSNQSRYPENGYIRGNITNIKTAIKLSFIPQEAIVRCIDIMRNGIEDISNRISSQNDGTRNTICQILRQNESMQTWRMAGFILLNAGIFYEDLVRHNIDMPGRDRLIPLATVLIDGRLTQEAMIRVWQSVLEFDYAPVFETSINILRAISAGDAADMLTAAFRTINQVIALNITRSGDVYGNLYQTTLTDRESAAAHYTRPEAATMLSWLVMDDDNNQLWEGDPRLEIRLKNLRIADMTCGTGMLLTAAYTYIICKSPRNIDQIHSSLMGSVFFGYDIMPTATHLTVSNLAGLVPAERFDPINVYTLPIGPVDDRMGEYNIGSLELIRDLERFVEAGTQQSGMGEQETNIAAVKNRSCDYIIMNPPFSRAKYNRGQMDRRIVPFDVFGIDPDDQEGMSHKVRGLFRGTAADCNAGVATNFVVISDRKIKLGGRMGFILPRTSLAGQSWQKIRALFGNEYEDITIILVKNSVLTFSADTDMNELMLIAKKRSKPKTKIEGTSIKLIQLNQMPQTRLEAVETARAIRATDPIGLGLNDGTIINVGGDEVGVSVRCPVENTANDRPAKWWLTACNEVSFMGLAYGMVSGDMFSVTTVSELAEIGPYFLDIYGTERTGNHPRGPFDKVNYRERSTYQALWKVKSSIQDRILTRPDASLQLRPDADLGKSDRVWSMRSHVHFSIRTRYTAQKTIVAYTNNKVVGGASWTSIVMNDERFEKAFSLWCNSIFGIMAYWLTASTQQQGRGHITLKQIPDFHVLDFRTLSESQLGDLDKLFDQVSQNQLLPINMIENDHTRRRIDETLVKILNIDVDLNRLYEFLIHEEQMCRSELHLSEQTKELLQHRFGQNIEFFEVDRPNLLFEINLNDQLQNIHLHHMENGRFELIFGVGDLQESTKLRSASTPADILDEVMAKFELAGTDINP